MTLHHSQQTDLDHLLPFDIIEYCRFDRFDFKILLTATPAQGRWPTVKIWLDGKVLLSSTVEEQLEYTYSETLDMNLSEKILEIEYVGKTDKDTVTNDTGSIVENQSLTVKQVIVNGIDIIANETIYRFGNYTMDLPPEKRAYYIEHGYSVEPTHSLDMFENGHWRMHFPIPITTNIVKLKATQELHEKWPDPDLLNAIVDTVNNIRRLEQKLKEQQ